MNITDRPKAAAIDIGSMKNPKKPKVTTLLQYFTDDEAKMWRVSFLKDLAKISKAHIWNEYLEFIQKNMSGDITSFSKDHIDFIDKMIKAVDEKRASESRGDA